MNKLYNIDQLDKKLSGYQGLSPMPKDGWIKTIRLTLGMTYKQFASRLGLSTRRLKAIENSEIEKKLKLETLEKIAEILGCELQYALVPKRDNSFMRQVEARATQKAKNIIMASGQHMSLEDQLASNEFNTQVNILKQEILHNNLKALWNDED